MTRSLPATIRRRSRFVRSLLLSPTDAGLVLRMVGWRLVLPLLKRRLPLPRLVRLMWLGDRSRPTTPEREARIAELARVVYRSEHVSRRGNCLERSLVLYRYLSAAGADPHLVVGMKSREAAFRGHAWITVREEPVEEPPQSLEDLTQVVCFCRDGSHPRSHGVTKADGSEPGSRVSEALGAAP
jgi:transglutaminase superfamily protein